MSRHADENFLLVPMDHSVSDGPIAGIAALDKLMGAVVAGGADGIVVHKGRARTIDPMLLQDCALVIHLSASTAHATDADAKVLVGDVEEALRLGADAVSVHVNIGSDTEMQQLADMGGVAAACDRWGVPLLAMVYPRGRRIVDPRDPDLLAHVVNIAADLGADLVKTTAAATVEDMAGVVASSPIPVLVAGGPGDGTDMLDFARSAVTAGCRGLAVGRRVFRSPAPQHMVRQLASIVHGLGRETAPESDSVPTLAGAL